MARIGFKWVALAIATTGLIGIPSAFAGESLGDRDAAAEVSLERQSRVAQCTQVKTVILEMENSIREVFRTQKPDAGLQAQSARMGEMSLHLSQASRQVLQIKLSDEQLQSYSDQLVRLFDAMSLNFDRMASVMIETEQIQQQMQEQGTDATQNSEQNQRLSALSQLLGEMTTLAEGTLQLSGDFKDLLKAFDSYCEGE
ncbi:MAG: hypothetical protein AAF685_11950 [Cyanobacteria bacterium P01_C01_bin.89]